MGAWAGGVPSGGWLAYPTTSATFCTRAFFAKVEVTALASPRLLAVQDHVTAIAAIASHPVLRVDGGRRQQHSAAERTLHCVREPSGRPGRLQSCARDPAPAKQWQRNVTGWACLSTPQPLRHRVPCVPCRRWLSTLLKANPVENDGAGTLLGSWRRSLTLIALQPPLGA